MLARVLYRDGLMLIIDKPAGLSVHRGPKGGPSLEDYLDGAALRPAAPPRARPSARQGHLRLPRARPPPQGARPSRPALQAPQDRQDLLGRGRRRPRRGRRNHRPAARPPRRPHRLVDEARPERRARGDEVESVGQGKRYCDRPQPIVPLPRFGVNDAQTGRPALRGGGTGRRPDGCKRLRPSPAPRVQRGRGKKERRRGRGRASSRGSNSNLSPAAPTNFASTARRRTGRSSATTSTARRRASAARCCICMRARSWCRSARTSRRCASSRPCRRTCASG